MSLIISRYSYLFKNNNVYYIFNSENCFLSEVTQDIYETVIDRDFESLHEDTLSFLKKKKILVESESAELFYQESKFKYELNSYNKEVLNLTLVPTLSCNFSCEYCFEVDKQNKSMTQEIIDNLLLFIKDHKEAKKINLTWYGGEPLIAFNLIKEINEKIKNNIDIPIDKQSVITNGYLLTDRVVNYFYKQKIKSIQITLDGEEGTHNKTRKLHSGKGTFQRIIQNINNAVIKLPDCEFLIRVNINHINKEEYIDLFRELNKRWTNKNVHIYPGFIREETKDGKSLCSKCIQPNEIAFLYENFKKNGVNIKYYPRTCEKGCMINSVNSYIIGPEGEIYKCWNDVSNKEKIIGYINKKEILNKTLFYRYMQELSPFSDDMCRNCELLPICSGGCGWYRYKNRYENGSFDICSMYKGKELLEKALLSQIKTNQ